MGDTEFVQPVFETRQRLKASEVFQKTLILAEKRVKRPREMRLEETRWLMEHPGTWVAALTLMRERAEAHQAKGLRSLNVLKPKHGKGPSAEYLAERKKMDEAAIPRLHFLEMTKADALYAKSLIGFEQRQIVADDRAVQLLSKIHSFLLDGLSEQALEVVQHFLSMVDTAFGEQG